MTTMMMSPPRVTLASLRSEYQGTLGTVCRVKVRMSTVEAALRQDTKQCEHYEHSCYFTGGTNHVAKDRGDKFRTGV